MHDKSHVITAIVALSFLVRSMNVDADDFPIVTNNERDTSATPMAPTEAASRMRVPDGFEVNVFAAEPDVQNPIAMAWDARGRLWIAENYTYSDRSQRFDLSFRDRVVILHDSNGDGKADRRTVFSDKVQMLTSVAVGHGGVWLMCPPQLLFIPDADRDDVADGPAQVMLDGFTVAQDNYHNFANGLKFGPDGWLYGRCGGSCPGRIGTPGTPDSDRLALEGGIWRYHPTRKAVEVLTHGTTNPWGHDWNSMGHMFFINTVNGHLWHLIPGAHLKRPFTLDPNTKTYELLEMHADHWHFDTGQGWTKSRDGAANEFGGGHAHTGMMIYLGDNWPAEYRDRLFTFNIHGRRANQEILQRKGSGFVGKHGNDMLLAEDPFFRGNDLSYGPDGAVYLIDWSDTGECHEHTGVHRTSGRVYRVTYQTSSVRDSQRDLVSLTSAELLDLHKHPNEWYTSQARLVLSHRARDEDERRKIVSMFVRSLEKIEDARQSIRYLSTLHAIDGAGCQLLIRQLRHPSEHVRALAVRLLVDHWPLDDIFGPTARSQAMLKMVRFESKRLFPIFRSLAQKDDSGLVRLALASALQRIPLATRVDLASELVKHSEDANDHNLPLLVWYGLIPVVEEMPDRIAQLAIDCTWPKTQRFIVRRLSEDIDKNEPHVSSILKKVFTASNTNVRLNVLRGMEEGLRGWKKAPQPTAWPLVVQNVQQEGSSELTQVVRRLSVVFGEGRALDEIRQIVIDKKADVNLRRSALETMVETRADGLRDICLAVLDDPRLNVVAAKGLAYFDDPQIARHLIRNYRRFRSPQRPKVISLLASRVSFANELLDAIEKGKIPVADLTAYDVRQIHSLENAALSRRVTQLWGDVRETSAEKRRRIEQLRDRLSESVLKNADLRRGQKLFEKECSKCHRLFGVGESVGPDLTGGNRNNLDYLLENIVAPSAVVSKGFQMSVLHTKDGQVFNGLVLDRTPKAITIQTQTDRVTIPREDIHEESTTPLSPMPDGLLNNLTDREIADLIAYLMQPAQVP